MTVILLTGLIVKAQLKNVEKPEPAALVKAAPEGADWPNEIKFDGYRITPGSTPVASTSCPAMSALPAHLTLLPAS